MNYLALTLVVVSVLIGKIRCCATDKDCQVVDSICINEECACKNGSIFSSDRTKCLPYVTEYHGECSEDTQCAWLGKNSECKYVCKCKDGYRWYKGKCIKYVGLEQTCKDDSDCFDGYNLQSLACKDGKCGCSNGYYKRGTTDCRKIASKVGDICALDIDCQFDKGECHLGICTTSSGKSTKVEKIEQTLFLYGTHASQECESDADCSTIPHSECYQNTCICKRGYFFNDASPETPECISEIGGVCKNDTDCKMRPSKCTDGVCYCRDYYFVDDGNRNCIKSISQDNWNCLSKEWCYALGTYSFCSSNASCNCSKVSTFQENDVLCEYDGHGAPDCTSDYDCKYIKNGYCVDESCGCQSDHVLMNNTCSPKIDAECEDSSDCLIQHSECRDNTCQCVNNYVSYENTLCYIKRDKIGDDCEVDVQCSAGIEYSKCLNKTCACDTNYLAYKNSCYEQKEYGSYCNNQLECWVSMKTGVQCRNRMCQCPTGEKIKDNKCSSSIPNSINHVLVFLVLVIKGVLFRSY